MKKYELVLKENEEMMFDCDDLMSQELVTFKKTIKDIKEKDMKKFGNWTKIYKALNYDIFEGLEVKNTIKFNDCSAVIELRFRGKTEYDLLNLNPETMTVACMNVRDDKVRPYVVRRLLVPQTVEEALMYAKSPLPEDGIKSVAKTIETIKNPKAVSMNQEQEQPKQETTQEQPKQETVKEQPKKQVVNEQPKQQPKTSVPKYTGRPAVSNYPQPNYSAAVGRKETIKPQPKKPARPKCGWQADGSYKFY